MAYSGNLARGFAVEDSAAIALRFENGALGNLTLSDAVQSPWALEMTSGEEEEYPHEHEDCYILGGTEGSLAVPTLTHVRNERGGGRKDPYIRKELFYMPANPWVEELLHFREVIRGRATSMIDAEDGTRTRATLEGLGHHLGRAFTSGRRAGRHAAFRVVTEPATAPAAKGRR